jgi:hypothetical protein
MPSPSRAVSLSTGQYSGTIANDRLPNGHLVADHAHDRFDGSGPAALAADPSPISFPRVADASDMSAAMCIGHCIRLVTSAWNRLSMSLVSWNNLCRTEMTYTGAPDPGQRVAVPPQRRV